MAEPTQAQIAVVRGAVARGWCHDSNRHKEMDSDLAEAITQEVLDITAAAQAEEPIDYVNVIGKREIEWRAAAENHVDEIERLKAEIAALTAAAQAGEPSNKERLEAWWDDRDKEAEAATIERCAQVARGFVTGDQLADARLWLAIDAINALKDKP